MVKHRAHRIHQDSLRSVFVVQAFGSGSEPGDGIAGVFAWSRPVAVISVDADGARAVDTCGNPTGLDQLVRDVDGLRGLLGAEGVIRDS